MLNALFLTLLLPQGTPVTSTAWGENVTDFVATVSHGPVDSMGVHGFLPPSPSAHELKTLVSEVDGGGVTSDLLTVTAVPGGVLRADGFYVVGANTRGGPFLGPEPGERANWLQFDWTVAADGISILDYTLIVRSAILDGAGDWPAAPPITTTLDDRTGAAPNHARDSWDLESSRVDSGNGP